MASIPASQATARFTSALVATYMEMPKTTSFLRSFFPAKEYLTKYLRIEVMRGGEKIAVDVVRGSEGNRNRFERSTEKIIEPPYFREYFDLTELDIYDRLWGSDSIDGTSFGEIVAQVAEKMQILVDKIERAYELMCAQVLLTGIITLSDGTSIDYKRKAASLVDGSATTWATGTNDPYAQIGAGINFIRTKGRAQGGTYNMIMGESAADAFFANAIVLARGPLSNINFDQLRAPQRDSVGGAFHGTITAKSYKVNLWTYPEYYDDATDTTVSYIDTKKIIIIPEAPKFVMGFAAVPQLIDTDNRVPKKGAFIFGDYVDRKLSTHEYDVKSAGVPIPVAVDQIYTRQVLA
ncbi:MAG: major capsid protein [Taibaiella sp.]|jgi:hypothetical protein